MEQIDLSPLYQRELAYHFRQQASADWVASELGLSKHVVAAFFKSIDARLERIVSDKDYGKPAQVLAFTPRPSSG